ncbi:chaperone NapD [Ferrimonas senticii]|uniref:chaperone NapD n=1 Tax=Ferrimonas senticii TaxID=394566 RepID=UPI0003FE4EEF|nr:chaperone NapD [Ferrimonas senticii]
MGQHPQELHVASLVVHANPSKHLQVQQQIATLANAELVSQTDDHRYIVVLDGDNRQQLLDSIEALQQFDGVISTALAYHQVESVESENAA